MNGTVYFKDGHTEEVEFVQISDGLVLFTKSKRYYYNNGKFYVKKLMSIEMTCGGVFEPVCQYFVTDDIDRIEIPKYTIIG